MRLTDINDFIDARRVYLRSYYRAFGEKSDEAIYLTSVSQIRELASLTDTRLERVPLGDDGVNVLWKLEYRGTTFHCLHNALGGTEADHNG